MTGLGIDASATDDTDSPYTSIDGPFCGTLQSPQAALGSAILGPPSPARDTRPRSGDRVRVSRSLYIHSPRLDRQS